MMKRCRFSSSSNQRGKNEQVLSSYFPQDLVIEIFEWLPVKSIVRFRCLAKPWSAIFKSPTFIQNRRRKQGSKGTMLLVCRCLPPTEVDGSNHVFSFHDLDSPATQVRPSLPIIDVIGRKRSQGRVIVNFAGHCNGIVCMTYGAKNYFLCNLALREFKRLPSLFSAWPYIDGRCITHGFGVGNADNDFKVIRLNLIYDETSTIVDKYTNKSYIVMVHLYTYRTNSWRRLEDAPVLPVVRSIADYVFINGACHWLGRTFAQDHKTILCFDIESEVFRQMELPDCLRPLDIADAYPIVLNDGCLGLLQYQAMFWKPENIQVWGMKEYGTKGSWTKMFVLSPQPIARAFLSWKNDFVMVYEPKHGLPYEEYRRLQDCPFDEKFNSYLASICLRTNEVKKFPVCGIEKTVRMLRYEESLVSLY